MKIIDKTPLQDANGNISFFARVQGTLKYGFSWYGELEAQKKVIEQLDRSLEKGHVLIRNFALPNIEVIIPLILIGTGGISVIYATPVKGFFEAKGDQWNTVSNGRALPASPNLIDVVRKRARALQRYLQEQKINLPNDVDSVLITVDPGAHVDSTRPNARVVMGDAIKQFASSLLQASPVFRADMVYDIADRLVDPRPREEPKTTTPDQASGPSRAQAIFNASESAQPFDNNDFGFAFEEGDAAPEAQRAPQNIRETNPSRQLPRPKPAQSKKIFGMSTSQVAILAAMLVLQCCILVGFAAAYYFTQ
ncbi:MAG: hypothetical protein H7Y59_02465 [Anaerolineales bacterium]|nr:hypothetical protein [Anaerolineales bacterium]